MRKTIQRLFLLGSLLTLCACGNKSADKATEDTTVNDISSETDASESDAELPSFLQKEDLSTPTTATSDGAFNWQVDWEGKKFLQGLTAEGKLETTLIIPNDCVGFVGETDEDYLNLITENENVISVSFLNQDAELTPYLLTNCPSVKKVYLPQNITTIPQGLCCIDSSLTEISIPSKVTSIEDYGFWLCSSLTNVSLNEGLTSIGEKAFWGCDVLEEITIPSTVEIIGPRAFSDLKKITFAEGSVLTTISEEAFYDDDKLKEIILPEGVTSIGDRAFYECDNLSLVYIPESVKFIGEDVFEVDALGTDNASSSASGDDTENDSGSEITTSRNLVIYVKAGTYSEKYLRGLDKTNWTIDYYE